MKIMVCLKQVPHQDARLDIDGNGTWIKEDGIKFEINSYDTYALEEALQVKDAEEAEVVVVSIGPDRVTQSLRTALGMGADRAIHVNDDATNGSDVLGIAKTLAAVAKEENPDLVYMGLMSEDGNFAAIAPMLAELLGIPHTTAAVKIERSAGSLTVDREIEGGANEVVELQTPCLVAVQSGLNQVRYASLKGIMAAKKKPLDVKTVADLGLDGQVGAGAAKVQIAKIAPPIKGDTAEILQGSNDEIVAGLMGKIKELGLL
ncbi:MAG: electron transfer flavoprotein subunit beta/FixA family protein [Deltaproteobacteria bacterium]|nr:electron transfer flavoprotein subunit beta/FixA family protein [Deltaproteobacteria bacterium]MBW2665308.1 electron transfer flavoprotein subunit beta/FixA family protein [Deltaproteobacteria bacterium]